MLHLLFCSCLHGSFFFQVPLNFKLLLMLLILIFERLLNSSIYRNALQLDVGSNCSEVKSER